MLRALAVVVVGMVALGAWGAEPAREVAIFCDTKVGPAAFGAGRIKEALRERGWAVVERPLEKLANASDRLSIVLATSDAEAVRQQAGDIGKLDREGFVLRKTARGDGVRVWVVGGGGAGAMYGALELAEQLRMGTALQSVAEKASSPRFPFRAVKFNLPWMSYRKGPSLQLHMETCRDLAYWEKFLDMMAENRFNALTLWNLHPFTWMIRPKNFPEACGLSDAELADWQAFWKKLFRMARDRGIETYIVDWNIFVSPEFAKAHGLAKYSIDWSYFGDGDTSERVKRYNRECVTQVIDEYEDLAGIGISLGERMGGMTPQQREEWIVETVVAGMKQAKRKAKLIHRAPFSANTGSGGSTDATMEGIARRTIESLDLPRPIWVEAKFNWSHGHSSTRLHIIHGGKSSDAYWNPMPKNYRLTWMIRNEDFFCLRWGEPGFIRQHIANNGQEYVGGYFVGSECYIPARNYFEKEGMAGAAKYAFERQWLFYMLWGRLLYEPTTPDAVFGAAFDRRYGQGTGARMLPAYERASRMPLRLASFYKGTWDFTLYSEGFIAAGGSARESAFISIDELIKQPPLDPAYVSIAEYCKAREKLDPSRTTPLALADALEADGREAMRLIESLSTKDHAALALEAADVRAWAHLSLYFAEKLRAGVALEMFRTRKDVAQQQQAIARLEAAARHWDDLVKVTEPIYQEMPLVHLDKWTFHWAKLRDQVQKDIELARNAK